MFSCVGVGLKIAFEYQQCFWCLVVGHKWEGYLGLSCTRCDKNRFEDDEC